jgi:hypothetical protein
MSNLSQKSVVGRTTLSLLHLLCIKAQSSLGRIYASPSISLTIETRPGSSDRRRTFQLRVRTLISSSSLSLSMLKTCNMRGWKWMMCCCLGLHNSMKQMQASTPRHKQHFLLNDKQQALETQDSPWRKLGVAESQLKLREPHNLVPLERGARLIWSLGSRLSNRCG